MSWILLYKSGHFLQPPGTHHRVEALAQVCMLAYHAITGSFNRAHNETGELASLMPRRPSFNGHNFLS